MEDLLVSSGDVVEVVHQQDDEGGLHDNWEDEGGSGVGESLLTCIHICLAFAHVEGSEEEQDVDEDDEGRVDEELDSHPLDEGGSSILVVLLEPLEPLERDPKWQQTSDDDHDTVCWLLGNGHNTPDDGQDGVDHTQDGHDLHASLDWDAQAAGLSFFLESSVRHLFTINIFKI